MERDWFDLKSHNNIIYNNFLHTYNKSKLVIGLLRNHFTRILEKKIPITNSN